MQSNYKEYSNVTMIGASHNSRGQWLLSANQWWNNN